MSTPYNDDEWRVGDRVKFLDGAVHVVTHVGNEVISTCNESDISDRSRMSMDEDVRVGFVTRMPPIPSVDGFRVASDAPVDAVSKAPIVAEDEGKLQKVAK